MKSLLEKEAGKLRKTTNHTYHDILAGLDILYQRCSNDIDTILELFEIANKLSIIFDFSIYYICEEIAYASNLIGKYQSKIFVGQKNESC